MMLVNTCDICSSEHRYPETRWLLRVLLIKTHTLGIYPIFRQTHMSKMAIFPVQTELLREPIDLTL